ncbi:MAG TPA: cupin domain-containing protein, partial [Caulobacterales bacterium]|nr:cupin domain-containing protein [Caulobacterales bacterium]
YVETFRDAAGADGRAHATAIYFLLQGGERSHWHRVDAAEIWAWHAGAPLALSIDRTSLVLGPDLAAGERPQAVVPAHAWQAARSLGDWTLATCVVAPGFEFNGFELAPPDFRP